MQDNWSQELSRRVGVLQRRCFRKIWLRNALLALLPAGLAAGSLILLLRIGFGSWQGRYTAVTAAAGVLAALFCGAWRACRATPNRRQLLAWLDSITPEANALLITQAEYELGPWAGRARLPRLPRLNLTDRRAVPAALAGLVYLGAACLIPIYDAEAGPPPEKMNVSQEVAALEDQLELLAELEALPDPKLEELHSQIEELKEEREGTEAAELYEAIQDIENQLTAAGENAAAELMRDLETLETFADATEALSDAAKADIPGLDSAMAEYADLLREMGQTTPEMARKLSESGLPEDFAADDLTPEQLQQLASKMRAESESARQKLERLAEKRLSGKQNKKPGSGGGNDGSDAAERLAAWLEANSTGADSLLEALGMCQGMLPGTGGVGRGRGDAPLTFDDRDVRFSGHYEDLMLEGEEQPDAEDSDLMGTFAVAPPEPGEELRETVQGGALAATGDAGDQRDVRIYPQHRSGVARYFDNNFSDTNDGGSPR